MAKRRRNVGHSHETFPVRLPARGLHCLLGFCYVMIMGNNSLSIRNLAVIALLLEEETEERFRRKRKRIWVHQSLKKRKSEGEFWTLYEELEDDEVKF